MSEKKQRTTTRVLEEHWSVRDDHGQALQLGLLD
jgi:hypothetical protein